MALTEVERAVLAVMGRQSPGYLISPHATAFIVEGLEPGTVEATLTDLWGAKLVEHITTEVVEVTVRQVEQEPSEDDGDAPQPHPVWEEVEETVLGDDGLPVVIGQGWALTDAGRVALSESGE